MNKTFEADRQKALRDICDGMLDRLEALASEAKKADHAGDLVMPEVIEAQEKFRWVKKALAVALDLQEGKSLSESFAQVSKRYDPAAPQAPVPEDIAPANTLSGRASAFIDVRRALDIAARDFDISYQPLTASAAKDWLKKHPIGDEHIRIAHKENQRHFMKESIKDVQRVLHNIENPPPKPVKRPRPPGLY